jgi:hypothetical protein
MEATTIVVGTLLAGILVWLVAYGMPAIVFMGI